MEEKYICFYTAQPFWTCEVPNIDFNSLPHNLDGNIFTNTLSERTLVYEKENLYIAFCKDGCVMTKIGKVEDRIPEFKALKRVTGEIPPEIQYTSEYLDYLNSIQILLASAMLKVKKFDYFKCNAFRNDEVFAVSFTDAGMNSGIPKGLYENYYMGRYLSQYRSSLPILFHSSIMGRISISKEVFDTFWEAFQIAYQNNETIRILGMVNSAYSEYKNLNFRQSLIQAWFVIEFIINKKWQKYLESKEKKYSDGSERINSERKELLAGKDYTASIMSNCLELIDDLDFQLFKKIDNVRRRRNDIVHSLDLLAEIKGNKAKKSKKIKISEFGDAFSAISELIKQEYNLEIKLGTAISYGSLESFTV